MLDTCGREPQLGNEIRDIPEIRGLDERLGMVRIPPELDVPLTNRVRQIIDSTEFRRLSQISQLGLVGMVYPAAQHTRFEHSLGVYRMALLYLRRLSYDSRFVSIIRREDAEMLIVAALLHDLGHWPFCHPIEDIQLPGVPEHELFANSFLLEGEIADALREDWSIQPRDVVALLSEKPRNIRSRILHSILSGPIDIDKMDYLMRDSLHAGVPYGRNFDQQRLIASLCLNKSGDELAITEKGRTAAEMMVFARYVMFGEVYWHHAVRSATSMLQRAFFDLHAQLDLDSLFRLSETALIDALFEASGNGPARDLLSGLFGPTRRLYKRTEQFTILDEPELHQQLARRPFPWLVACGERFAHLLSRRLGRRVAPHEVLFDAPPMGLEVEFNMDVYSKTNDSYRRLGDVSPVVRTLASQQFDDYVKRVRIFVHGDLKQDVDGLNGLHRLVAEAIEGME